MSWRLSQGIGRIADGTTSGLRVSAKLEALYEADGAFGPGEPVVLDTGDTEGRLVIKATEALDHKVVGVYEGQSDKGASGADTTVVGMVGKRAADGDIVWVTTYGRVLALVGGTTTLIADGDALIIEDLASTGGQANTGFSQLDSTLLPAGPLLSPFIALQATATSAVGTGTARAVFVRCM